MHCSLCAAETHVVFTHQVLNRLDCRYHLCPTCGLLQTEEPYWLAEAYASPITPADTGMLQRNIAAAQQLSKLLFLLFDHSGRYVDIAGGYGLLVRLMRDKGYDFFWHDAYTDNIHARGFEADFSAGIAHEAVTAFEVLEHVRSPLEFVKDALSTAKTGTIILTTELFAGSPPSPESWWYYCFATGQHISFYQRRTLEFLARRLGLSLYSHKSLHIMTDRSLNPLLLKLAVSPLFGGLLEWGMRHRLCPKTMADHLKMLHHEPTGISTHVP